MMTMTTSHFNIGAMAFIRGKSESIKKDLTLRVTDIEGGVEFRPLYQEVESGLLVPRAYVVPRYATREEIHPKIDIKFSEKETLNEKQKGIVSNFFNNLPKGSLGGILKAGTGTGKTVMAIYMMSIFKKKTLVVVPLSRLMKQWKDSILRFSNIKENEIGIIQGKVEDVKGKKVVIGMIQTLAKKDLSHLENEFGLTIYDEGHVLGAKEFSKCCPKFNEDFRLMLSATPKRKDGAENVFKYHIGQVVTESVGVPLTPVIYQVNYQRPPILINNLGVLLSRIARDSERNKIIAHYIGKAYEKGRNILILSDRIEQLTTLSKMFTTPETKSKIGYVFGKYSQMDKQVIFATYGAFGMAMDIPRLDTLILATPRADIEQAAGRVLRLSENKKTPVIIDIRDMSSEKLRKWAEARKRLYKRMYKSEIKEVTYAKKEY